MVGKKEKTSSFLGGTIFLSILRQAYKEFEQQVESTEACPAKSDLVRQTVLAQVEQFTLGDLTAQLLSASSQLIKKILGLPTIDAQTGILRILGTLDYWIVFL